MGRIKDWMILCSMGTSLLLGACQQEESGPGQLQPMRPPPAGKHKIAPRAGFLDKAAQARTYSLAMERMKTLCDPRSPYALDRSRLSALVASPLLGVEVFRDHIIARLGDQATALPKDPKRRPRVYDPPAHARVADLYAEALADIKGAPAFDIQAPTAERAAAIAAMQKFLREHGDALGETDRRPAVELSPSMAFGMQMRAKLRRQKATASGRPLRLPDERVRALWHKEGGAKPIFGWVHSGEEVREEGRSRRYFSLVWDHGVERLPAEALEFPGPPSYYGQQKTELGEYLMLSFGWPDPDANGASGSLRYQPFPPNIRRGVKSPPWKSAPDVVYRTGKPLWMSVSIGNRSGYDQAASGWTRPLAADERPEGIRIQLIGPMGQVPRRQEVDERAPDKSFHLLPGQREGLFRLNLNAHFHIRHGGNHHMVLIFDGCHGFPKGTALQRFDFEVVVK